MPCPIGSWQEVEIGGRRIRLYNPGPRAVMEAQEESIGRSGQVSPSRYLALIGARWCDPKIDLSWFRHEGEVLEFMRAWDSFRRPNPLDVRISEPYCPEGKTATITLSNGRELKVLNPGMRWVLEAQDDCTNVAGRVSWLAYAERVLRDCVVGGATFDVFSHEDEVVEFLRLFRLMRIPPTQDPGRPQEATMG